MGRSPRFSLRSLRLFALSAPTNDHGQQDVGALEAVLRHERTPQTYITFLACTDDLASVNYLSHWDKAMPNLDVIDDYQSERAEILRTRGANFPFSYGDYIVKSLLGSSDPWSVMFSSFEITRNVLVRFSILGSILWMSTSEQLAIDRIRLHRTILFDSQLLRRLSESTERIISSFLGPRDFRSVQKANQRMFDW